MTSITVGLFWTEFGVFRRRSCAFGCDWHSYRTSLMAAVSSEEVLAAAKRANPKCQVILKYLLR